MVKYRYRIITVLCIIFLLSMFPCQTEARSLSIEEVLYEAELLSDGSMIVNERISISFIG